MVVEKTFPFSSSARWIPTVNCLNVIDACICVFFFLFTRISKERRRSLGTKWVITWSLLFVVRFC